MGANLGPLREGRRVRRGPSRSTKRATGTPYHLARTGKGTSSARTTSWRRAFSGSWRSYSATVRHPPGPHRRGETIGHESLASL